MDYGKHEEAIRWYRLYTKIRGNWLEEHFEAQLRIANCYIRLDADSNLIEHEMKKAIDIYPDRAEPYFILGNYFNNKKQSEKAYQYLKQAQSKDVELVKQKYLLFINEFNYGKYVNDELSVACYWTDRYDEGIKLIEEIIDDPKHNHDKKRLLDNLNFLKQKINK